jgi:hypothetical protein
VLDFHLSWFISSYGTLDRPVGSELDIGFHYMGVIQKLKPLLVFLPASVTHLTILVVKMVHNSIFGVVIPRHNCSSGRQQAR